MKAKAPAGVADTTDEGERRKINKLGENVEQYNERKLNFIYASMRELLRCWRS